jgi:hypothetical protein
MYKEKLLEIVDKNVDRITLEQYIKLNKKVDLLKEDDCKKYVSEYGELTGAKAAISHPISSIKTLGTGFKKEVTHPIKFVKTAPKEGNKIMWKLKDDINKIKKLHNSGKISYEKFIELKKKLYKKYPEEIRSMYQKIK